MYYIYVLKSQKNNRYYTGSAQDVGARVAQHNAGKSPYDKLNKPFDILHQEAFSTRGEAVRRERYLKTGKGREELSQILENI